MAYDIIERKKTVDKRALAGAALLTATATAAMALTTTPKGKEILQKIKEKQKPGAPMEAEIIEEKPMLVSWLNNAYAMEGAQIKTLRLVITDFKDEAEIKTALEKHLAVTQKQKDDVAKCLAQLDEKPSKAKEMIGSITGMGMIDLKMFKDKKAKGLLSLISAEHFETASYEALAVAAQADGKKAIANTMNRIAKEEREMAGFLEKRLPAVIKSDLTETSEA